ncbi:transcription repressor OFP1-like [Benincasa hispida]|uniref:transcription repressor OFP1-like n=1 Tax=Benincasa hispida TaxID=102211 RepID=UPI00190015AC|nr:transcription repressor OFP1-like [Benincasa hispida]
MGNYRFRLSNMMPNSWFDKLKDMSIIRRRNQKKEPCSTNSPILLHSHPRKSHHFPRQPPPNSPPEPPRKSSKGKPRRRPSPAAARTSPTLLLTSSPGCSCTRTALQSVATGPTLEEEEEEDGKAVIFEKGHKTSPKKINGSDEELKSQVALIDLPPIITRSTTSSSKPDETDAAADGSTCPSVAISKKDKSFAKEPRSSPSRRFQVNSPGPKLRIMNSPRVSSKRFGHVGRRKSGSAAGKRSLSDSLAIVKSTNDPHRDFRESMVEMIVENKISASNELEDLLACYLSLNTEEYHDIIVKVFKQIWFDMTDIGVHY